MVVYCRQYINRLLPIFHFTFKWVHDILAKRVRHAYFLVGISAPSEAPNYVHAFPLTGKGVRGGERSLVIKCKEASIAATVNFFVVTQTQV